MIYRCNSIFLLSFSQDTCVALQALAVYSEQTAGSKLDLKVTIRSELGRVKLFRQLRINKNNALLQQSVDVSLKWPYLQFIMLYGGRKVTQKKAIEFWTKTVWLLSFTYATLSQQTFCCQFMGKKWKTEFVFLKLHRVFHQCNCCE